MWTSALVRAAAGVVTMAMVASCRSADAGGPTDGSPDGNDVASARLEWSTLDPREANNTDLAPLMRSLRDARVVVLGEVHSDGASYSQKTRLVRALHEELGFGVVAFESSAFDMWQLRRRWPRLRDAAEARASHGSNPLWARADTLEPMFDYLLSRRFTTRPLTIFGLDSKIGEVARDSDLGPEAIDEDLGPFLRRLGSVLPDPDGTFAASVFGVEAMLKRFDEIGGGADAATRAADARHLEVLGAAFADGRAAMTAAHGAVTASFAELLVRGLRAHAAWYAAICSVDEDGVLGGARFTNARDVFMADALQWYLDVIDPEAKIIVWTGGFHGFADPEGMQFQDHSGGLVRRFAGSRLLAAVLRERLGDAVRIVGCTTWHGDTGSSKGVRQSVPFPEEGSIEWALESAGARVGSIDMTVLPSDHPWRGPQWCSAYALCPVLSEWPRQLDVLLYARSTFLHSDPHDAGPPLDRTVAVAGMGRRRELDGSRPRSSIKAERIFVVEPLVSLLETASVAAVELSQGLWPAGSLQLKEAAVVAVTGDLAGDLHAGGALTATVSGGFTGSAYVFGPSVWRVDGPFSGRLTLRAPATIELRRGLDRNSDAVITALRPGTAVKLSGFTPADQLERLVGEMRVELQASDLAGGTHRIGALEVTVLERR